MPLPCASLSPKRSVRNDDARYVVYSRFSELRVRLQHIGQSHRLRVIDHVLQGEESGGIGLGFLDRAVQFLQLLARRGRLAVQGDLVRAQAVAQLVGQDVGEEGVEVDVGLLVGDEHALGDRHQDLLKLGLLHVLQHDALAALLGTTRSSLGRL